MDKPDVLENKTMYALLWIIFITIIILIAPYINTNIYARSQGVYNGGGSYEEKEDVRAETEGEFAKITDNSSQRHTSTEQAYRSFRKKLKETPGVTVKVPLEEDFFFEKVNNETKDGFNKNDTVPKKNEIYKFHGDRAFTNETVEKKMDAVVAGELSINWKEMRLVPYTGLLCATRGVFMLPNSGSVENNYKGKNRQDLANEIYKKMSEDLRNGKIELSRDKEDLKVVYVNEDEKRRPKSTQMIFRGFKNSEYMGGGAVEAVKKMADRLHLKYTIGNDGNLIVDQEEFERIAKKYGKADRDGVGDFLTNTDWEFVDDDTIKGKEYDTSDGFLSQDDIEARLGDYTKWEEKGIDAFKLFTPAQYIWIAQKVNPEVDKTILSESFIRHQKYVDSEQASPFSIYIVANEKPQDRESDEEGQAPYKYAPGVTPGSLREELRNGEPNTTHGLQGAWWQIAEGILGWKYIKRGYVENETPLMGESDLAYYKQGGSSRAAKMLNDSENWRQYWLALVEYIDEKKAAKPAKAQKSHYIKFKNGEGLEWSRSSIPFTYEYKDYFNSSKIHTFNYPYFNKGETGKTYKYRPMFVDVDGKKPGDQRDAEFRREDSSWIIGPYKLDYFQYRMPKQVTTDHITKFNFDGKPPLMANVIDAKLKGRYRIFPDNGGDDQSMDILESDASEDLPDTDKFGKEVTKKVVESINDLSSAMRDVMPLAIKTEQKDTFNNLSKLINNLANNLSSRKAPTGNDIDEIGKAVDLLKQRLNQNNDKLTPGEKKLLNDAIKKLDDSFNKLKNSLKGTGLNYNTEYVKDLNKIIPRIGISIQEALDFFDKMYISKKEGSVINQFIKEARFFYREVDPNNARHFEELIHLDKEIAVWQNAVINVNNTLQSGKKPTEDQVRNVLVAGLNAAIWAEQNIESITHGDFGSDDKIQNPNRPFPKYVDYVFSNSKTTDERRKRLDPLLQYNNMVKYDAILIYNALESLIDTNKEDLNPEAKEALETLEKNRQGGIYGDMDLSKNEEYEKGQQVDPAGEDLPSKNEIAHDKRKDTSQKTDRQKEYGKEEEEYKWEDTIIEDNNTEKLNSENTVNSLENLEGTYRGLVGKVPITPGTAEELFPLSIDQLKKDIADKRGNKTDIKLYGGIQGDLGMLLADSDAMKSEGRSSLSDSEMQALSEYALSDQIMPDMPTFTGGSIDAGNSAADLAHRFEDLASRGAALGITGFRADKYIKDAKNNALATKLYSSAKEYRNGTDVYNIRKGKGADFEREQNQSITEATDKTSEAITKSESRIKSLEDDLYYYERRYDEVTDPELKDLYARLIDDTEKDISDEKTRKKEFEELLKDLRDYRQSYDGTYPRFYSRLELEKNKKYIAKNISENIEKIFKNEINKIVKLERKENYKKEIKLAFERKKELENTLNRKQEELNNNIKEMGYTVFNATTSQMALNNSAVADGGVSHDNGGVSQNEGESGKTEIKEIKDWKFLITKEANKNNKENYRTDQEKENRLPNPGDEFYYVIKHDPQLMEITAAIFDFGYMVSNANYIYYTGTYYSLSNIQTDTKEKIEDFTQNEGNKVGIQDDGNITFTPLMKAHVEKLDHQVIGTVRAGIWLDTIRIELKPSYGTIHTNPTGDMTGDGTGKITEIVTPPKISEELVPEGGHNENEDEGEENTKKVMARLYLPIAGRAWIDKMEGTKHLAYNHVLDDGESGDLQDVFKVDVRRVAVQTESSGDKVKIKKVLWKQQARLFKPGTFEKIDAKNIYTDNEGKWGPFNLHDLSFSEKEFKEFEGQGLTKKDVAVVFEVVYSYDGLKYTEVIPLQKGGYNFDEDIDIEKLVEDFSNSPNEFNKSSQAVENPYIRMDYNRRFAEMEGGKPYDQGDTPGTENFGDLNGDHANSVKKGSPERTGGVKLEYESKGPEDGSIYGTSKLIDYKAKEMFEDDADRGFKKARIIYSSTLNLPLAYPIHKNIHIPADSLENADGADMTENAKTEDGKPVEVPWYNGEMTKYYGAVPYMKNINFGAKERETVRLTASKDLLTASLFIKNKAITYFFDEGFDMDGESVPNIELSQSEITEKESGIKLLDKQKLAEEVDSKNTQGKEYKLDLYKADYLYRTAMYKTTMKEPADMGSMAPENDLIKSAFGSYANYAKEIYDQMKNDMNLEFAGDSPENGGIEDTRQLDIFLTYKVSVSNMSDMDDVVITEIRDQYNPKFMEEVKQDLIKYTQESPSELYKAYGNNKPIPVRIPKTQVRKADILEDTQMKPESSEVPSYTWGGEEDVNAPNAKKAFVPKTEKEGIRLEPLTKADIYTVYRLRRDGTGINGLKIPNSITAADVLSGSDNILGNIVEIGSFASYERGTDILSARVDAFSAPGNVPNLDFGEMNTISDYYDYSKTKIEADTAFAPGLKININEKELGRRMDGVAWEDSRNKSLDVSLSGANDTAKLYVGNGIKDPEEKPIRNQKIILEERIPVSINEGIGEKLNNKMNGQTITSSEYLDVPFIWPDEVYVSETEKINIKDALGLNSVQRTGDNGEYKFTGIPAGNFVIKAPYTSQGEGIDADNPGKIDASNLSPTSEQANRTIKWINGVDFKSTFYRNDGNDNNLNETWIPKVRPDENNLSYIRDDEFRRTEVMKAVSDVNSDIHTALESMDIMNPTQSDIDIIHNGGRMIASTPKIAFSIENLEALIDEILESGSLKNMEGMYEGTKYLKGTTATGNKNYPEEYDVPDINAGIVQRPISKMELRKDITNVTLETNNGKKIIDLKFDLEMGNPKNDEDEANIYEPYLGAVDMSSKLNDEKSIGQENVMTLNTLYGNRFKIDKNNNINLDEIAQGFIYINMDEQLMQGSTLKAEYAIRAVNLSEPDLFEKETREKIASLSPGDYAFNKKVKAYYAGPLDESVKLNHEAYKGSGDLEYGHLLEKHYYKPINATSLNLEQIDTLEIQEIMEIVDNNCEYDEKAFKGRPEEKDALWKKAIKQDLVNKIITYRDRSADTADKLAQKASEVNLVDENGVPYIDDKRSNIYISTKEVKTIEGTNIKGLLPLALFVNSNNTKENVEKYAMDKWYFGVQKYIASLALEKDLSFDNTAELLKYNIAGGKRLRGIRPGDVFNEGNYSAEVSQLRNKGTSKLFANSIFQKDAFTTEKITITPPTGIKLQNKKQMIIIMASSVALVIFTGIVIAIRKKYLNSLNKR